MLEIKPIEDKKEQENICKLCGIRYRPELFAYKAYEKGELLAAAQFDIEGKNAAIYDMRQVIGSKDDSEAIFILGRAVLNFLDLCGVETVCYITDDEYSLKTARLIGFKETDHKMRIRLKGLFTSPCQHGNSYRDISEES